MCKKLKVGWLKELSSSAYCLFFESSSLWWTYKSNVLNTNSVLGARWHAQSLQHDRIQLHDETAHSNVVTSALRAARHKVFHMLCVWRALYKADQEHHHPWGKKKDIGMHLISLNLSLSQQRRWHTLHSGGCKVEQADGGCSCSCAAEQPGDWLLSPSGPSPSQRGIHSQAFSRWQLIRLGSNQSQRFTLLLLWLLPLCGFSPSFKPELSSRKSLWQKGEERTLDKCYESESKGLNPILLLLENTIYQNF